MTTTSGGSGEDHRLYSFVINEPVERRVELECATWQQHHGSESQLRLELANAAELLAAQPFLGRRIGKGTRRVLVLPITRFSLVYRVEVRAGIVRTMALVAPRSRRRL